MLLNHSLMYLFARGVPSIVGFVTIIVYTRLLTPEAYGQYALVVTGAIVVNAVLYQWLSASLLRFLPQYQDNVTELMSSLLQGFLFVSLLVGIIGFSAVLIWSESAWGGLIAVGAVLSSAQAWFSINLELVRSRLQPTRYGIMSLIKSVVALGLGSFLVSIGYEAYGALAGLFLGFSFAAIWASWGQWRGLELWRLNRGFVNQLLSYGLPLTVSLALAVIVSSTDRFMLAGMLNEAATGLYVASQGLTQQTVGAMMTMVNLAAYPLILRTLEKNGLGAARTQLRKSALLLLGVGLPAATCFVLLAANIARVFLGVEFRVSATELIPWFALAALMSGVRAYYFDIAFYLGKQTRLLVFVMASAALLNVVLNFMLIPVFGIMGAAYATVASHALAMVLSCILGYWSFRLQTVYSDWIKLAASALVMAVALYLLPEGNGVVDLTLSLGVGVLGFLFSVLILNPGGVRLLIMRYLSMFKGYV